MLFWWRSTPRAKVILSLALAGGAILATVLVLAIPLVPHPSSGRQTQASAYAARDERGEYAHWQSLGVDGSATPTPTPTGAPPAHSPTATTTRGPTPTGPAVAPTASLRTTFATAATRYGVPAPLLEAFCYMEGRLSNHGGSPSIDNGFGCMHLVHNDHADTLDQAAKDTGATTDQLRLDIRANILGGAAVLRDEALRLSPTHTLPAALADWYGAVEAYSGASTPSTAKMYADALYQVLNTGFSAQAETGEVVTLAPQSVQPNAAALPYQPHTTYPKGCTAPDSNVDYPPAVDCILPPTVNDCEIVSPGNSTNPCNYDQANRPSDYAIDFVLIHDIEGTAADAISTFQNPSSFVSCHYVIGSDGTVYQILHEKDIAWHAGNYWYNQHSVGIEHAGFDATGYEWYNAAEYLASAKLTAYLLHKYGIPLDRNHIVAHGTVPSPTVYTMPNHVDPGPYWLWDYYFNLIHQQGVPFPVPQNAQNMVVLYPPSATNPVGGTGTPYQFESSTANFSFFYLYNGPSTTSGKIVQANPSDITDETNSVEPGMTFYYVTKTKDQAGTGDTMYEIWYGEADRLPNQFQDAKLAWLAVPPGAGVDSQSTVLTAPWAPGGAIVQVAQPGSASVAIYGKPLSGTACVDNNGNPVPCVIGSAPTNAVFSSAFTVTEDGNPSNLWYEINYNHRQAWVPASEVTVLFAPPGGIQSLPTPIVQPR